MTMNAKLNNSFSLYKNHVGGWSLFIAKILFKKLAVVLIT